MRAIPGAFCLGFVCALLLVAFVVGAMFGPYGPHKMAKTYCDKIQEVERSKYASE